MIIITNPQILIASKVKIYVFCSPNDLVWVASLPDWMPDPLYMVDRAPRPLPSLNSTIINTWFPKHLQYTPCKGVIFISMKL